MQKIKESIEPQDTPQPGESSGKKPLAEGKSEGLDFHLVDSRQLSVEEILNSDIIDQASIPYYKEVYQDVMAGEDDWAVTKKVKEYADYLENNPDSLISLPPIQIFDGKLYDGAHRLSAIYLLTKLHPNSHWASSKLRVDFYGSNKS